MDQIAIGTHKYYQVMKKTLQFVILVSFFTFMHSYFSGFPCNLHFTTLVFPLLDRKYMFLLCNGVVVFLANNLSFSGFIKNAENGVAELPFATVEANVAAVEYAISPTDTEEETEQQQVQIPAKEMKTELDIIMLESEDSEEDEDDANKAVDEVNDASVSTEELNKKFEEFIRKMKEEIRIEAQ